jgi:hypothetical protein
MVALIVLKFSALLPSYILKLSFTRDIFTSHCKNIHNNIALFIFKDLLQCTF